MNVKVLNARLRQSDFIYSSMIDLFKIENTPRLNKQRIRKNIQKGIKSKEIKIALVGSKPVGFLWLKTSKQFPFGIDYKDYNYWNNKYCWINYVYVSKKYRNRGIGSILYKEIIKFCKRKKIKEVLCDVFTANKKSILFHKKRGYKPVAYILSRKIK